jgi:hypothetical protein
VSAPEEREHNWYPVSQVAWFTAHIREGIAVTGHQLELLQLGLARPGRLDDATAARIVRRLLNVRNPLHGCPKSCAYRSHGRR